MSDPYGGQTTVYLLGILEQRNQMEFPRDILSNTHLIGAWQASPTSSTSVPHGVVRGARDW
jgi:hypothetical protein